MFSATKAYWTVQDIILAGSQLSSFCDYLYSTWSGMLTRSLLLLPSYLDRRLDAVPFHLL